MLGRHAMALMSTCTALYSMRESYLDGVYRSVVTYLRGVLCGHDDITSFMSALGCDEYIMRSSQVLAYSSGRGKFFITHLFVFRSCSTSELYMLVDVLRAYASHRCSLTSCDRFYSNSVLYGLSSERSYSATLSGDNAFLSTIFEGDLDAVELQRTTLLGHWNHFVFCLHFCERIAGRIYFPALYTPLSCDDEKFTYECWLLFLLYTLYSRDNFAEYRLDRTLSYEKTEVPPLTWTMHPMSRQVFLEFHVYYRLGSTDNWRAGFDQPVNYLTSVCDLLRRARSSEFLNLSNAFAFTSEDYSSLRELYARFYYYLGLNKIY